MVKYQLAEVHIGLMAEPDGAYAKYRRVVQVADGHAFDVVLDASQYVGPDALGFVLVYSNIRDRAIHLCLHTLTVASSSI